jgi:hypothetical protein
VKFISTPKHLLCLTNPQKSATNGILHSTNVMVGGGFVCGGGAYFYKGVQYHDQSQSVHEIH